MSTPGPCNHTFGKSQKVELKLLLKVKIDVIVVLKLKNIGRYRQKFVNTRGSKYLPQKCRIMALLNLPMKDA